MSSDITKPQRFTALEMDAYTSIAEALWKRAAQTQKYIEQSYPVGMLLMFHETQSNLPHAPDAKYWQLLDGSAVSNANSPLNGVTLPDLRDMFFRHPGTGEVVMAVAGSDSVNLAHTHGGVTGSTDDGAFGQNDGGDHQDARAHTHSLSSALTTTSKLPKYIALKLYVRIV